MNIDEMRYTLLMCKGRVTFWTNTFSCEAILDSSGYLIVRKTTPRTPDIRLLYKLYKLQQWQVSQEKQPLGYQLNLIKVTCVTVTAAQLYCHSYPPLCNNHTNLPLARTMPAYCIDTWHTTCTTAYLIPYLTLIQHTIGIRLATVYDHMTYCNGTYIA